MKNFLLVVVACVATLGANAQTKSVQLIGSGGRLAILEGPSGSGSPLLFSLPTTGGTLLVENSSAAVTFGSLTLSNAINQLTFGSGNTILINAPAPSASRTYTLPDVGANASFVMTEGTQTINGAKTFTTVPVLGSLTGVLRASSGVVGIDTELTALSLLGTTGHIVRTGANTYASRTILGTSLAIDVTNGSGVGGNPTIDLADSLDLTGKGLTGGTFWNPTINGGTLNNVTINGPLPTSFGNNLVVGTNGSGQMIGLPTGSNGNVLTIVGGVPTWTAPSLPSTNFWSLSGNTGSVPGTGVGQNYIGTSDNVALVLATNSATRMSISGSGNVSLPATATPAGNRFSVSSEYTNVNAPTGEVSQAYTSTWMNNTGAASSGAVMNGNLNLMTVTNSTPLAGLYGSTVRFRPQNGSSTIGASAGYFSDFDRVSGGGMATFSNHAGFRSRFNTNNNAVVGSGLLVDSPITNDTTTLNFTGVRVDAIPGVGNNQRVFWYNRPGYDVVINSQGQLVLGAASASAGMRLDVHGTAGTPNVRFSSLGSATNGSAPSGFDRLILANTNGELNQVALSTVFNGQLLPTTAAANSTLRWNGINWVANAGVLADGSNNLNVTGGLDVDGTATIGALNGVVKATAGVLSAGQVNLTSEVTGVLPIANGGTGAINATTALANLNGQPLDADLTAVAGLSSNGIVVRTGAGAFTTRSLTQGTNITITNSDGVAGSPTIALSTSLNFSGTTVTGGTFNNSAISNPTLSGTVTISGLASNSPVRTNGSGALTTGPLNVATEVTGVLPIANGGTGANNATTALANLNGQPLDADLTAVAGLSSNGIVVRTGAGTATTRSLTAGTNVVVTNGSGVSGDPTVALSSTLNFAGTTVTGGTFNNGTIANANVNNSTLLNPTLTGTITISGLTANRPVRTDGAGALTTGAISLSTATDVTGILPVGNGGTGISTTPTANQILVGNGAGYSLKTLTAGTGISIVDGGSTLTINNTSQIIPAGTVTNATLVWNGTSWVENTNVTMVPATGNTVVGGSFDVNGNVELGDAISDVVTITAGTITGAGANKFANRVQITGDGTTVTFAIPNTIVVAGSVIVVTLEDGTDTNNYTATVASKTANTGFNVRLSGPMAIGATKWVNYTIINP